MILSISYHDDLIHRPASIYTNLLSSCVLFRQVAGSVYKTQALKPNVLNELIAHAIADHRPNVGDVEKHTSADDSYALEDETGRFVSSSFLPTRRPESPSDRLTSSPATVWSQVCMRPCRQLCNIHAGVIVALFGTLDQEGVCLLYRFN